MERSVILAAPHPQSHRGQVAIARLVNAVRRRSRVPVLSAFVDAAPHLADVMAEAERPTRVVSLALFDSVGNAPALGSQWAVAEVLVQKLIDAKATYADTIVLGTGPIGDASGIREVGLAAQRVSAVWGGPVHIGALGGVETPLETAIDIARAHGGRLVLASLVLTEGVWLERMRSAGADVVTEPLLKHDSTDPRLVELVRERVAADREQRPRLQVSG